MMFSQHFFAARFFFIVIIVECHSRCLFLTIILIEIQLKSHKSTWDYITSTVDTKHVRIYSVHSLSLSLPHSLSRSLSFACRQAKTQWQRRKCVLSDIQNDVSNAEIERMFVYISKLYASIHNALFKWLKHIDKKNIEIARIKCHQSLHFEFGIWQEAINNF